MRIKIFTLLFLLGMVGLCSINAQAQQDSMIDPSEIRYWIGEGENQAILAVNWNEPDTCLAWGFRFTGENPITLKEMMVAIAEADYRFSFDAPASFVNDIMYNDGVLDLSVTEYGYMMYNVNGMYSWDYYDARVIEDGDFVKWGDTNCGTIIDPENWVYVWESPVVPVYPLANEAMIDASEILYWIGEGNSKMMFTVNFAEPNVCYAWGYRFSGDGVTVKDVMDGIAAVDRRFNYNMTPEGWLTDITLDYEGQHLELDGFNSMYNLNGVPSWFLFTEQTVADRDLVKWGDISCGTEIAPWTYVWETPITPISIYTSLAEQTSITSLYPNPASSYTMISVAGGEALVTVSVVDLQGRVLNSFTVTNTAEPIRVETVDYEPGVYFVTVVDGSNRQTAKLVVK